MIVIRKVALEKGVLRLANPWCFKATFDDVLVIDEAPDWSIGREAKVLIRNIPPRATHERVFASIPRRVEWNRTILIKFGRVLGPSEQKIVAKRPDIRSL